MYVRYDRIPRVLLRTGALLRRAQPRAMRVHRAGLDLLLADLGEALARLNVDEFGLDDMDARILTTIIEKFAGGPVGIASIAASSGRCEVDVFRFDRAGCPTRG